MSGTGLINGAEKSARHVGDRSLPEFKVDTMTVQQTLDAAQEASRALNNQSVGLAIEIRIRRLQNEWYQTAPEEKNKREDLYRRAQELSRIPEALNEIVVSGQNLLHQQKEAQRRDQQEFQESQY